MIIILVSVIVLKNIFPTTPSEVLTMINSQFVHLPYTPTTETDSSQLSIRLNPKCRPWSHLRLNKCDNWIVEPTQLHLHNLYDFSICIKELLVF